jgi:hypothetical protein
MRAAKALDGWTHWRAVSPLGERACVWQDRARSHPVAKQNPYRQNRHETNVLRTLGDHIPQGACVSMVRSSEDGAHHSHVKLASSIPARSPWSVRSQQARTRRGQEADKRHSPCEDCGGFCLTPGTALVGDNPDKNCCEPYRPCVKNHQLAASVLVDRGAYRQGSAGSHLVAP